MLSKNNLAAIWCIAAFLVFLGCTDALIVLIFSGERGVLMFGGHSMAWSMLIVFGGLAICFISNFYIKEASGNASSELAAQQVVDARQAEIESSMARRVKP